jgi:hypothetical protein
MPSSAQGGPFAASHALPIGTYATHDPVVAVELPNEQYEPRQNCMTSSQLAPTAPKVIATHVPCAPHTLPFAHTSPGLHG